MDVFGKMNIFVKVYVDKRWRDKYYNEKREERRERGHTCQDHSKHQEQHT